MRILEYPTKSLIEQSVDVEASKFGTMELFTTISHMRTSLISKPRAVGIAAPQVGINQRIIIIKTDDINRVMINPVLTGHSESMFKSSEGCLSIPKVKGNVQRHWSVVANYQDEHGEQHSEILIGFTAAVAQHEVDHLDGILFTDRLTGSDKKKADKKLAKRK